MVYSGTLVTHGTGVGVVGATGEETELGEIHRLVSSAEELEEDRLERKGLISRQSEPGNRRILRVSLTSEGDAVVDACDGWMDKLEKQMVHDLGAPERRALRAALDSCIRALSPPSADGRR